MNGNSPVDPTDPSDAAQTPPETDAEVTFEEWFRYWAKRLLWCNPFYLASAALLLYGISRLTESPDFHDETTQMFFNFGSLQLYEILLVATAILLARRRVWYDSTLLVVLDSIFAFVPFILVSQAAFLGEDVTWLVCATGGVLATSRFFSLKVFHPRLNLPIRLLGCGAVLLLVNIALPLVFKHEHQLRPDDAAANLSLHGWLWLMPVLLALGNLLPRPSQRGDIAPECSGLPVGLYAIWTLATGYHLFRLGYIYDLVWNVAMLAPVLWVAAWTLYRRLTDFVAEPKQWLRSCALWLPAVVTVVATFDRDSTMFFALSALNAAIYGAMYFLGRERAQLFQLTLLSLAAMVAGLPEAWGRIALPEFDRARGIVLAVGANALIQAMMSRVPQVGVFGAFVLGAGTVALFPDVEGVWYFAIQNALVFLLLHSLRWTDGEHEGAALIRILAGLFWVGHAIVWVQQSGAHESWPVELYATGVWVGYVVARVVVGKWGPRIIPIAASLTLIVLPCRVGIGLVQKASIGLIALVGSVLLFVAGTALAWTKEKWHRTEAAK